MKRYTTSNCYEISLTAPRGRRELPHIDMISAVLDISVMGISFYFLLIYMLAPMTDHKRPVIILLFLSFILLSLNIASISKGARQLARFQGLGASGILCFFSLSSLIFIMSILSHLGHNDFGFPELCIGFIILSGGLCVYSLYCKTIPNRRYFYLSLKADGVIYITVITAIILSMLTLFTLKSIESTVKCFALAGMSVMPIYCLFIIKTKKEKH